MTLDTDIQIALGKLFKLSKFAQGIQWVDSGNQPDTKSTKIQVDQIWVAKILWYFPAKVYVAGIRGTTYTSDPYPFNRVALLIAAKYSPFVLHWLDDGQIYLGENPYRFMEIQEPLDPVAQALQQTTLFPIGKADIASMESYFIDTYSNNAQCSIFWEGIPQDEPTKRIRNALMLTIDQIVEAYDDEQVKRFFDLPKHLWH